jgi:hypothetical protein
MPTSFAVRRLRQFGPVEQASISDGRDVFGAAESLVGGVSEVATDEVRLTAEAIVDRLNDRWLRSTDLIFVDGGWTTIADSMPFAEVAAPFARRERVVRTTRNAVVYLGFIAVFVALKAAYVWLLVSIS